MPVNPDATVKVVIKLTPVQYRKAKAVAKNNGFIVTDDKSGDVAAWLLDFVKTRI